jgi:hypothetical protein
MKVTRKHWAECPVFFFSGCEGLINDEACPREGEVNGDGDRTGINSACYAYEVRFAD